MFPPLLNAVVCLLLSSSPFYAQTYKVQETPRTPYDSQIERIEKFIQTRMGVPGDNVPPLQDVNRWIAQLRSVRYAYTVEWKTPEEMQTSRSGDCKAKAIALYYLMRMYGAKNLLLVVGRRTSFNPGTHAWLLWKSRSGMFILDPTLQSKAIEVNTLRETDYVPHFGYAGRTKYRPTGEG